MLVYIPVGKGTLLQIQLVLMRESIYNACHSEDMGTTVINGSTWTLQSLK